MKKIVNTFVTKQLLYLEYKKYAISLNYQYSGFPTNRTNCLIN